VTKMCGAARSQLLFNDFSCSRILHSLPFLYLMLFLPPYSLLPS
jgi:hypothetical protein